MKILDVGQCGFDGPRMARLWQEALGAEVDCAQASDDAVEMVQSNEYDVVLVNRVLAADGSSGLEVIARLLELGLKAPVMLVSDLPEAQDAAVRLGAVRGFGKVHLGEPSTLELVSRVASDHRGTSRKER
jgi:DNA-binding response OmpR family regulator